MNQPLVHTLPALKVLRECASLRDVLMRCKRALFYVGLFSLAMNLLMLGLPLYSLQVLDRVMSSHSESTLVMLTLISLAMFVFYGMFSMLRGFILTRIAEWLDAVLGPYFLSNAITRSSLGVPSGAGQQQRDILSLKGFLTGSGITTLFDAPWSIIYILVIYLINPVLGLLTVVGAIMLLGLAVVTEFATKKPLDMAQKVAINSQHMAEIAGRNAEAIEAMGMMPNIIRHWQHYNKKNVDFQLIAGNRANILASISRVLRLILQIAVIGVGGFLALHAELSVGGMIAASILTGRALGPFEAAIGVWKSFINARDAYTRLNEALKQMPNLRGSMDLPAPRGMLSVESLFYRPPNSDKLILKGVSFQVQPGESLGIIGPSAAGKSTLAKLIIGILPPSNGFVRLDGAEIFKWNREYLGRYVGYLPQEVELFSGTIKDNIARMDTGASDESVIAAAQIAGVHEMILRLPKGYETEYSQVNMSLSPGQRQRIGLARALYSQPRFLVLDEPNSNLDGDGERALIHSLQLVKQAGITAIIVAHRPSIVANADKLLMLRDGIVEAFGPRDQVLQKYTAPATLSQVAQQQAQRG